MAPFEIFINFPGDASRERLESPLPSSAGLTRWAVAGPNEAWWQRGLQVAWEAPCGTRSSVCCNQLPPNRWEQGLLHTPRSSVPWPPPSPQPRLLPGTRLTRRCLVRVYNKVGQASFRSQLSPHQLVVLSLWSPVFKVTGTVTGGRSWCPAEHMCPRNCPSHCRRVHCGVGVGLTATQRWPRLTWEDELMTL